MTADNTPVPSSVAAEPAEATSFTDPLLTQAHWEHLSTLPGLLLWASPVDGRKAPLPSWYSFTGQHQGAPQGHEWLEAIHPDDRPAVEAQWTNAQAADAAFVGTFRL